MVRVTARRRPPRSATSNQAPRTARLERAAARGRGRGADPHRRRAARAGERHVDRRRRRPQPGHRVLRLTGRRGRRRRGARGARRSSLPAAGGDRTPDPRPQDTDARLPARRGHPLGRADRADPAPEPAARRGARRSRRRPPPPSTASASWTSRRASPATMSWRLCRRTLGERRVGHAGTLDPDATGVLLVGVGSVTRLHALPERRRQDLHRRGRVRHRDHHAGRRRRGDRPPRDGGDARRRCRVAVDQHLVGAIMQVPPMVSAIKVGGRRLHELAREGIEVERAPRPVTVRRFDVAPTDDPLVYRIEVLCSSGTYIRTLAADLGHLLGGGAHLRALRRTSVGELHRGRGPSAGRPASCCRPRVAVRDYWPPSPSTTPPRSRIGHGSQLERPRRRRTLGHARRRRRPARRLRGPWRHLRQTCRRPRIRVASRTVQVITDAGRRPWPDPSVVTIGAYDGVHLGHQAVIAEVRRIAAERSARSVVVTFDRHPAMRRAARVGAAAAHRYRPEARVARHHRRRRHVRGAVRRGPGHRGAGGLRAGGPRRRARTVRRRRGRGLPLRPPPPGQRRPCYGSWAPATASTSCRCR